MKQNMQLAYLEIIAPGQGHIAALSPIVNISIIGNLPLGLWYLESLFNRGDFCGFPAYREG